MVFHNKEIDGSMRQKTIITKIDFFDLTEKHDNKVNNFNKDNNVFFNSTTSRIKDENIFIITVCLYANKNIK